MKNFDAMDSRQITQTELKRLNHVYAKPLGPRALKRARIFRLVEDGTNLAGIDCSGAYIRALRDATGAVGNAVVTFMELDSADGQVFVPGGRHFGVFAQYGSLIGEVIVTIDVRTAGLIHCQTKLNTIAVNAVENLARVCDDIAEKHPNTRLVIALDKKEDEEPIDPQLHAIALQIAAERQLKVALSGEASSFAKLLNIDFKGMSCKQQIQEAEVPAYDSAWGNKPTDRFSVKSAHPAPLAQNGSSLMHDLLATVRRTVITSKESAVAIALWIVFTYVYKNFSIAPMLVITSPTRQSGKTSALSMLSRLCHNPFETSNISEAAIYHVIEKWHPTLLIDEADTFMTSNSVMTGIINSGHKQTNGFVTRAIKNGVVRYPTFCPKAIASIGRPSETIMSRAIVINMMRKLTTEKVDSVPATGPDELTILQGRILRWTTDNVETLSSIEPERVGVTNDRSEDNYGPLLAIATQLGGPWLDEARAAFSSISGLSVPETNAEDRLLSDISLAFKTLAQDRITTSALLNQLCAQEEAPWSTYRKGREISAAQLGKMLSAYDITSSQMRFGERNLRGFHRHQFAVVFARYVGTDHAA